MARYWIEVHPDWKNAAMAPWVEGQMPRQVPGGLRWYFVQTQSFVFEFSTLEQWQECQRVLACKVLPSTLGHNQHWLSRLPARLRKWSVREKILRDLARMPIL